MIGSRIEVTGKGSGVALALATQLEPILGAPGRWIFLVGFWGAVFSSLLGVWQGVPYLFADFAAIRRGERLAAAEVTATRDYRRYQLALALVPMVLLLCEVPLILKTYAVLGAFFMPLLALTLLLLNNRREWVGERFRNGLWVNLGLIGTLLFFAWAGAREILAIFR